MKFMYLMGILLENIYRIFKSMMPMLLFGLIFKNSLNLLLEIIMAIIMFGGIWYEFKLTDFFK